MAAKNLRNKSFSAFEHFFWIDGNKLLMLFIFVDGARCVAMDKQKSR